MKNHMNSQKQANHFIDNFSPQGQSGFFRSEAEWKAYRRPILNGIESSASILDLGCANGYLLESLMAWGREKTYSACR